MLPAEQPGFVSSTVVSTTTVLRTKSESDAENSKDKDLANKSKRKNVLLQQLLMEDDDSATSPQDSNSFLKNDESQSNDNTTSPTVSTTKPKLTSRSGGGNQRGAGNNNNTEGFMDNDSNEIVQQLLQAANDMDDINQPDMIANFLKELEQSHNSSDAALMQNILGEDSSVNSSNDNQFNSNQRDNNLGMSSGPPSSNTNTMTTTTSHMPPNRQNSRGRVDSTNAPGGNQRQPPVSSGPNSQPGNFGPSPMENLGRFSKEPATGGHPMAQMQQMAPPNQTAPSQGPVPHMPPFPSPSPVSYS